MLVRRFSAAFCAAVTLVALPVAVASADDWGTGTSNTGAHPDSDPHTYCYNANIAEGAKPNISSAQWDSMDPTAVNVDYNSTCDYSSSSETDVVWFTGNLAEGVRGSARCEDFDTYCDQFYVTLDLAELNEGSNDEFDQTKTACHELGHTGGLTHAATGNDCMDSGEVPNTNLQWHRYNDHHKAHLTNWFN